MLLYLAQVIIINVNTLDIIKKFRVLSGGSSQVAIKSIEVARRGNNFLINGSDRVLRVYDLETLDKEPLIGESGKEIEVEPLQRLQDNVNRMQWKKCTFSGNNVFSGCIYVVF